MTAAPSSDLEKRLLELISGSLLATGPDFHANSDLFALGLDSMAIMQLLLLVEEEFGAAIPAESVSREHFSTVRSLARLIRQRLGAEEENAAEETGGPVPESAPAGLSPAPAPKHAAASSREKHTPFTRLPLLNCDHFVLAFDTMMRDAGLGGHVVHSFLDLAAVPDVERLRTALETVAREHPLLNAVLRRRWGVGLPEWRAAAEPRPVELLLFCEDGAPGVLRAHGADACADAEQASEDALNRPLPRADKTAWPKARFTLIERADGSCRLIFSWSHLLLDAVGAELFLRDLNALAAGDDAGRIAPVETPPPDPRHYGQRWANTTPMVNYFYGLLQKPFDCLGSRTPAPGRARFQALTFSEEESRGITERAARLCGPLVNMPFHLAVAMRAHDAVFRARGRQPASLICNVPVQRRRKGADSPIYQNHLGMFFGALAREELPTLEGAVASLLALRERWMRERLDASFEDLLHVMSPLPPRWHMKFVRWKMRGMFTSLFHSHTGAFAAGLNRFLGVPVLNACHVPALANPPGTGLFCSEKNGRLTVTLCWCEGALSDAERRVLLGQMCEDYGVPARRIGA